MKKKIYFLILIIILLAGLAVVFYMREHIETQGPSMINDNSQKPANVFSLLDDKDFSASVATESYEVGPVKFNMYPFDEINNTPGYFEVYENDKKVFSSTPNHKVVGLLSFALGENEYVIIKDYSGGAHCCDTDYIFRINKNNQVKLIKTLDMGNTTIDRDSLLFKNNSLYLVLTDDSFQYFHAPFAQSYFFEQYFKLQGDDVVLANEDFKNELVKKAEDCSAQIIKDLEIIKKDSTLTIETWLPSMLCKITNYGLAGKIDTAWQGFDETFNLFASASVNSVKDYSSQKPVDAAVLKQEIMKVLKENRFD